MSSKEAAAEIVRLVGGRAAKNPKHIIGEHPAATESHYIGSNSGSPQELQKMSLRSMPITVVVAENEVRFL